MFQYKVQWLEDESPDLSYLGKFSNRESEGAVLYSENPHSFRYFVPAITEQNYFDLLRQIVNQKNPVKHVYGIKTARKLARQYVQEDMRRFASYGETWSMQYCLVQITYQNRVIGSASLFGIESDTESAYKSEVEHDLFLEAYTDAKHYIESLGQTGLPDAIKLYLNPVDVEFKQSL